MISKYYNKSGTPVWSAILLNLIPFVQEVARYWMRSKERYSKLLRIQTAIKYYSPEEKAGNLIDEIEIILNEASN